ncbi:hypothetical protein [Clostridium sp. M14]|uniref:hypothetical protein n=1 Tax=Clostridium sp. M14 TaxID=2716311 RepID=UPI0013EEA3D5|nr:hypothetical protein [Clostridium sp. M14]MBZ9693345.1 hypothetical protein [Clostridium sp. M14]
MEYKTIGEYTVLKVYYRKEHKYIEVIIDTEDFKKICNKDLKIFYQKGNYEPRIYNGKYYMRLQSFLTPNIKISYSKNRNYCDCRKCNITSSPTEVDGLNEIKSIKIKEAFKRMSEESKNNILKGQRENRYSKDYSNKLQEDKFGEKNLRAVLTWDLINEIRNISRNDGVSQKRLGDMFNVGRCTIADIINYRTWTVNPKLNERVYKGDNIKVIKDVCIAKNIELDYDDIPFNNILLKFNDEFLYLEKLSIQGLIYIEQRDTRGKHLASVEVYIPRNKNKLMKKFYSIAKMNPKSKGRPYFYKFIDKAFNGIGNI